MTDSPPPEPLHEVVQLLLKRMESHPEEFMDARLKQMLEPYRQYLTAEEKAALKAKEREVYLNALHVRLMKHILADKEPLPVQNGGTGANVVNPVSNVWPGNISAQTLSTLMGDPVINQSFGNMYTNLANTIGTSAGTPYAHPAIDDPYANVAIHPVKGTK